MDKGVTLRDPTWKSRYIAQIQDGIILFLYENVMVSNI